jgi:quercetin dioxygenase-like cupin family protein
MFHFKLYEKGLVYGMVYTFPQPGDGIPMHTHEEEQKHNVVVMRGSLEVYGPDRSWVQVVKAGEIFDLEDHHHPHEICALEPDTVSMGLFIHGKPEGDQHLAEEDKVGTIDRPLVHPRC